MKAFILDDYTQATFRPKTLDVPTPAPGEVLVKIKAAALPLVCLTAWEGLVDKAMMRTGQKVLIHGGAGGVGHVAVQIARAFGAEVYATASSGKLDLVQKLGATAIDYTSTTVEDYVAEYTDGKGFDIIYVTVGGPVLDASFEAVCDYGHIVSCAAFAEHNLAPSSLRAATISGVFVLLPMLSGNKRAHHGEILRKVVEMADSGELFPIVDAREFTLDTAVEAHDAVEAGSAAIKVVINIAV